jgi:hypothetical protein
MFNEENAVNEYVKEELRSDVKHLVKEYSKSKTWITICIIFVFVVYVLLAIWVKLKVDYAIEDINYTNSFKRELAVKTDSVERVKIQEQRSVILMEKSTDSLKRVYTNYLVHKYDSTVTEWKKLKRP